MCAHKTCGALALLLLTPACADGMNTAQEWKDVLIESLKGAVILAILERLYITRTASWYEDHIGAFSGASFTLSKSY